MKKSFSLFSTLVLIFIFSILALKIYEISSINSKNIINQYKYLQAQNHLKFLQEYIHSLENLDLLNKIQIKDEFFEIFAYISKLENQNYEIEFSVKAIDFDIRVHKKTILKKIK